MRKALFYLCYAPEGAPSGGGPAGAPDPSPSPAPAPAAPAPSGGGAPGSSGTPGGPASPAFSYPEDRGDWIPPHRFKEHRQQLERLQRQYDIAQARVRSLAGLEPETRRDPAQEQLRNAFSEVMPELKLLSNPNLQKVLELAESGQLDQVLGLERAYWGRQAHSYGRQLVDTYAKAIEVDAKTLPPTTMRRMATLFQQFVGEDPTGERVARYENEDPELLSEFVKDMTGVFIEPQRRAAVTAAAATVEGNRRLPQQGPRGGVPPPTPAPKLGAKERREAAREFVRQKAGQ